MSTDTTLPNHDLFPLSGARMVLCSLISPGRYQPRKRFDDQTMTQMAASIKTHGVMQPVLLTVQPNGKFELVAGERRWRGAKAAGLDSIPAVVRELTLMQVLELQAIENIQREDLHPLEEAQSYDLLLHPPEGEAGYTIEQIADKVSKSPTHVRRMLTLAKLIPQAQDAFMAGQINQTTALAIARMPVTMQGQAFPKIMATRPSEDKPVLHKDADRILQTSFMLRLKAAPFPTRDATLVVVAGECHHCPKRTGANPDLFADVPEADTCTDPDCFAMKVVAHNERRKAEATAAGIQVIEGQEARALLKLGDSSSQLTGDYVYMDEPLEDLTGSKLSLAKLLGTLLAPSALFEHPKDETLREIVQVSKARQALQDQGLLLHKPEPVKKPAKTAAAPTDDMDGLTEPTVATKRDDSHTKPSAGQDVTELVAGMEAKVTAERSWRVEVFKAVHQKLLDLQESPAVIKRCAALDMATVYMADVEAWDLMCDLWGWTSGQHYPAWASRTQQCQAVVEGLTSDQLDLLMVTLPLLDDVEPEPRFAYDKPDPERAGLALLKVAGHSDFGIDWKRMLKKASKPLSTPPSHAPARGKVKAPPAGPSAKASTQENTDQAPQGAQGIEEDKLDLPHWVGQIVQEKGAKRLWKVVHVETNGDLRLGPINAMYASLDDKVVAANMVVVAPGQTRGAAVDAPAWPMPTKAPALGGRPTVRYRNRETGETWSGRGLQPKWIQAAIASGKTLADLEAEA